MKTAVRLTISAVSGAIITAAFTIVAFFSESAQIPLRWLSDMFQFPGATVLPWTHYGAPSCFKQITGSDGPAAAYLWMMAVSFFVWAIILSLLAFLYLRHLRPQTI